MQMEVLLWKKWPYSKAIEKLSMESDIPEAVLRSWLDGSYKNNRKTRKRLDERVMCRLCNKSYAEIALNKRTYSSQLCTSCRKTAATEKMNDKDVTFETGRITTCPRCSFTFLTKEMENDCET